MQLSLLPLVALFCGTGFTALTIAPFSTFTNVTVFVPPSNYTDPGVLYARTVELEGGVLLATWENYSPEPPRVYFPIYRSADGGETWKEISRVQDTVNNWGLRYQPFLYELPIRVGDFEAGTILCAGNSIPTNLNATKIDVYASEDKGYTWKFVSHVATGGAAIPDNGIPAIWEPFLMVYKQNIVLYYSDQRDPLHGQKLVHQESKDLLTWESVVDDVSYSTYTARPGMTTVTELPDSRYMMTYEYGGGPTKSTSYQFPVYYKIAKDPLKFNQSVGYPLISNDGIQPTGSPYITWSPVGGLNGTIFVSASSNSQVFVNRALGDSSSWKTVKTPQPAAYTRHLRVLQQNTNHLLIMGGGVLPPIVARIRPLLDNELDKDIIVTADSSQDGKPMNIVRIPSPKNESEEFSFQFNGVYDMGTTQEELFTNEVAPTLKSLFQGLDVTIFAYGVTGTGKTHTMRGGMKLSERGVIPRLLSGIYRRGRKVSKDSGGETSVSVNLSYYEIYNDKVYDLFESPEKRSLAGLPLREKDGKTIVVGLSERACDDLKDFERLYIEANNNRSTAGTKLNAQSSRSHAILMVKLIQTNGNETLISTASAIDLAGSEDNRRTENGKERMVESASINKSLFVLSQCVDAIGRGDKRIPYRESKMTRILSLGQNNGITIMILNLAPLRSYHLDTLSSLNVSSRAKRIEVREIENEVVFTQPPRKTAPLSGSSIQRQPLRPLANAHNTHPSAVAQKGGDKPAKAFSVYTDRAKPVARSSNPTGPGVRRSNSSNKRPSDSANSRPTKLARPTVSQQNAALSAAKIEELIERKVSEALANRALDQPVANAPVEISEIVQRRLEALERKVELGEAEEEARAEGLRFLLMAKQHRARGEDASALKMYEMALPFFPGQEKLLRKMEILRTKLQAKRDAETTTTFPAPVAPERRTALSIAPIVPTTQLPTPAASFEMSKPDPEQKPRNARANVDSDDEYNGSAVVQAENYQDDDSFAYKASKPKKSKAKSTNKSTLRVFSDQPDDDLSEPQTPRTRHLLDIINSRDVTLIKGLSGVGAKKARDLVEFLELQNDDDGGNIRTLQQFRAVPGVGNRTVERAYEGIALLLV
ncbi:hypothetical protein G7Y89_g10849 [Cudoniella acicularis]|uniref:Kinesin motor domain-containing protein n=1 Tax=Cudoniella acicularis TaxID=354080 RepID=A0A8H4RBY7_9HELO|nr:hypothetical protein G7Y89_g10849 [Cudoniella acicularis]